MWFLKNVKSYDHDGISNLLEINLRYFYEMGFLKIGGVIPHDSTILRPDTSNNMTDLSVWHAGIQNWAARKMAGNDIIVTPATIRVNGILETAVDIDYNRGQVTFDRELHENDLVTANHYTNRVNIFTTLELNRRPIVQIGGDRSAGNDVDFSVFHELAVQEVILTPFIMIETFPTGSTAPYALGTGQVWMKTRIQCTIVANTVGELSKILDIIRGQSFRTVRCFDTNKAIIDGVLPIDPLTGDINTDPNVLQYPELLMKYYIDSMYWKQITVRKFKTTKEDIHMGIASWSVEFISNPNA